MLWNITLDFKGTLLFQANGYVIVPVHKHFFTALWHILHPNSNDWRNNESKETN